LSYFLILPEPCQHFGGLERKKHHIFCFFSNFGGGSKLFTDQQRWWFSKINCNFEVDMADIADVATRIVTENGFADSKFF
jgi:hypothetical protein